MVKSFRNRIELNEFVDNEREEMYGIIVDAITAAYEDEKDVAEIITCYIEDEQVDIEMFSIREQWKHSLSLALSYYEQTEQYLKCMHIKILMDSL